MWTTIVKRFFYPVYILPKISWLTKKRLKNLFQLYKEKFTSGKPVSYRSAGLKVFSNMEEDGIILWLIASLNIEHGNFIDIGANDCINSNCANLVFNFNWQGCFIDADKKLLETGRRNYSRFGKTQKLNLKFIESFVTAVNINDIINRYKTADDIDLLSIDIDGNDYFIWQALTCVQPKIVLIENKIEYGSHDLKIPADKYFESKYWGASAVSMTNLAQEKGYRLVAANRQGFNMFFLRNDLVKTGIPDLKVEELLNEPHIQKDLYDTEKITWLADRLNAFNAGLI